MRFNPVVLQDFSGGWNPKWAVNASQLADNQSPYMNNADYSARFAFTKRRGFVRVGDDNATAGSVKSIYNFRKRDRTEILMKSFGTKMQYLNSGTWTDITGATSFTADLKFDFEVYKDTVYFCNGTDDFMSWTGSGSVTTFSSNPKGNIFSSAFLRLWVANAAADRAVLYYSAPDDFTNFATAGAGNTSFQYAIRSLIPFFDRDGNEVLQVLLDNGDLFNVGFDSSGTLFKKRVRRNVGSLNHRVSRQAEDGNLVLDLFQQVRSVGYKENVPDLRSPSTSVFIDPFLATLDVTNAASVYWNKNFLMSAKSPGSGSNDVTLLFDENYSSWRLYTGFGANHYAVYQNKVTFASSSDLNVYQFNSEAYADDSAPIYFEYQTKDFDFDAPLDGKTMRFVKIGGLISAGCVLTVKGYYDADLSNPAFTKTISGNGPYVQRSVVYPLGSAPYASVPFAGLGGSTSTIPLSPFDVTLSIPSDAPFDTVRLVFTNEQADVDVIVAHVKPYVMKLEGTRIKKDSLL